MSFYKSKVYKGNRPVVNLSPTIFNIHKPEDNMLLDADLKRIVESSIANEAYNNEVCFWVDGMVQATSYLQIYNIFGKGLQVIVDGDKEAEETINTWNKRINNYGQTIEDYIVETWIDNTIHTFSIWKASVEKLTIYNDDLLNDSQFQLCRMPPESIKIVNDPLRPWRKFEQIVQPVMYTRTYKEFLETPSTMVFNVYSSTNMLPIAIPNDPHICSYISFFKRSPMSSINYLVILKRWIWSFLRKFVEKMSTAVWIGYVGDVKGTQFPIGNEEMTDAINQVTDTLVKLRNFSAAAFPGNVKIIPWEPKSDGTSLLKFINEIDQQIMFGLRSSMAMSQGNSVYKGSDSVVEMQIRYMEAIRSKYEDNLRNIYMANLTPHLKAKQIRFVWQELRVMNTDAAVKAFEAIINANVCVDTIERRELAASFYPVLASKNITKEQSAMLDKLNILLKAPSQPGQTTTDIMGGKTSATNQDKSKETNTKIGPEKPTI